MTPHNIQQGFKMSGIYPCDVKAIPPTAYLPAAQLHLPVQAVEKSNDHDYATPDISTT